MIACDLGSNTLRIARFDCQTRRRTACFERIVRTAKDLHVNHAIAPESQERLFAALHEASLHFDFRNEPCFAVTTQAMRMASNAREILSRIETTFGICFEIISGEKEAALTSLAVEHALTREGFDASCYVLFDLGGGSTEITFCNTTSKESRSFPFGIVTTTERYVSIDASQIDRIVSVIEPFVEQHQPVVSRYRQLIATAGTPTTVAAFKQGMDYAHYDANAINGTSLHVNDFEEAFVRLSRMPIEEATRFTGTNRRDSMIAGILLVKTIMQKLGFATCIVIDDSLREGVAIANCNTSSV